jgi:Caspase domain
MKRISIKNLLIGMMMWGLQLSNLQPIVAQVTWAPDKYDGVNLDNQRTKFVDRFEDDSNNNWSQKDETSSIFVSAQQGLALKANTDEGVYVFRPFSFNKESNFQIESSVRLGRTSTNAALIFGAQDESNLYTFEVTSKGYYTLNILQKGTHKVAYKGDLVGSSFLRESFNTLTVRKIADKWYFFINQNLMYSCDAKHMFGTGIGWHIEDKGSLYSKLLMVKELAVEDKTAPLVLLMEPAIPQDSRRGATNAEQFYTYTTSEREIKITFRVRDQFKIKELRVNENNIENVEADKITQTIKLNEDKMDVIITAIDESDNVAHTTITFKYEPPVVIAEEEIVLPKATIAAKPIAAIPQAISKTKGKNFALFIGINEYNEWPKLYNPTVDCNLIANVLMSQYQFSPANVRFLFNEEATRKNILKNLYSMVNSLSPDDNLVIYYAGHGIYDSISHIGYWVPVDAEKGEISGYITNSEIRDFIRGIPCFHTLVMADACFAGALLTARAYEPQENAKSRWVITSGDMENVEDGVPGQSSPFAQAVSEVLTENPKTSIRADKLLQTVTMKMHNNTEQHPKGNALKDVGDQGGIFVFKRK